MQELPLEEARSIWGDRLRVAALRALEKGVGTGKYRVIIDATHGVLTNHAIRVRDSIEMPTARDLEALRAHLHCRPGSRLAIAFDVRKAHRLIPARRLDQSLQA